MVDTQDVAVYVYNFAVVLSGVWVTEQLGAERTPVTFALAAVLALGWTVYFKWDVAARVGAERTDDDAGENRLGDERPDDQ